MGNLRTIKEKYAFIGCGGDVARLVLSGFKSCASATKCFAGSQLHPGTKATCCEERLSPRYGCEHSPGRFAQTDKFDHLWMPTRKADERCIPQEVEAADSEGEQGKALKCAHLNPDVVAERVACSLLGTPKLAPQL